MSDLPINLNKLDTSDRAKTTPNKELHSIWHDGKFYRQVKRYKGYYCLGVEWEEYFPEEV